MWRGTSTSCGASNDIVVASHMLSRSHTRILCVGDHFMLQDLGTTSGTYVDGKQVTSCRLEDGCLILLGDAEFRFKIAK